MTKESIIYIDDEQPNLDVFDVTFRRHYQVFTASTTAHAEQILDREDIKVLISDQRMPEESGMEFISRIHEIRPRLICIILTAYIDIDSVVKALNEGKVYSYQAKPWDFNHLKMTIDKGLEAYNLRLERDELFKDLKDKNQELLNAIDQIKRNEEDLEHKVKERTAQLNEAKENADAANMAKSHFLSNMSHELRTPLNAILGFSKNLKYQANLTSEQRSQLGTIHSSGKHLLSIIDDILLFSRIDAQRLELDNELFDLSLLIQEVYNINRFKADEKELSFNSVRHNQLPTGVRGDKKKLKQVLLNLVNNAIKYTDVGSVVMRTSYDPEQNLFYFEVEDTGVGIADENHELIFEPFVQALQQRKFVEGTGLGLPICKELVGLLKGELDFYSTLGVGSTFKIKVVLPQDQSVVESTQSASKDIAGYLGPIQKVLIVNENLTQQTLFISLLKPIGFDVKSVSTIEQALQLVENYAPDALILDCKLPPGERDKLARHVRNCIKDKSVKIMSADCVHKKDAAKEQDFFLMRPFEPGLLFDMLKNQLKLEWVWHEQQDHNLPEVAGQSIPTDGLLLNQLQQHARLGDYIALDGVLEQYLGDKPEHSRFMNTIKRLAKNYDSHAILKYLTNLQVND